jgi:uncharacterized membrane protein YoaK (UPF0700 family)
MSSLDIAASPPIRRDQTVQIALLLAFAGGYIDAYTWIIHGVMVNAQTANLVLLWVYGTATKGIPELALGLPVVALLIVLLRCEVQRNDELI